MQELATMIGSLNQEKLLEFLRSVGTKLPRSGRFTILGQMISGDELEEVIRKEKFRRGIT